MSQNDDDELIVAGLTDVVPKKAKAKRSRSSKKKGAATRVTIVGDRFVCNYSGHLSEKAVFVPGLDAAFANLPSAWAWIEEQVAKPEEQQELKNAALSAYEQLDALVVRAPERTKLADFGGDLEYHEWIGGLSLWDNFTTAKGLTVTEYRKHTQKTNAKRGKTAKTPYIAAMYVLPHKKGAPKVINTLDGVETEKGAKGVLTPVRAMRKLATFINATSNVVDGDEKTKLPVFRQELLVGPGYSIIACIPRDDDVVGEHAASLNKTATDIAGLSVYGPAVAFFTKSIKI